MEIVSLIEKFGVTITYTVALMYALVQMFKVFMARLREKDEQIEKLNELHRQEESELAEVVNRNTVAIEKVLSTLIALGKERNNESD